MNVNRKNQNVTKAAKRVAKRAAKREVRRELPQRPRRQRGWKQKPVRQLIQHEAKEEKLLEKMVRGMKPRGRLAYNANGPMSLRAQVNLKRNEVTEAPAPRHMDYDSGVRLTIRCTAFKVAATGTTFVGANQLLPYTYGTSSAYGKAIGFGACGSVQAASSADAILSPFGSVYSMSGTAGVPPQNYATNLFKFYNFAALRSVVMHYTPSCPSTTTGNLAFAMKVVPTGSTFSALDESTYADIACLPRSCTTAVSAPKTFVLKPMISPAVPAMDLLATYYYASNSNHFFILACDTTLGAGSSITYGDLTFEIVLDLYGRQWNSTDTVALLTQEDRDFRRKVREALVVREVPDMKEMKEAKVTSWTVLDDSDPKQFELAQRARELLKQAKPDRQTMLMTNGEQVKVIPADPPLEVSEEMEEWALINKEKREELQKRMAETKAYQASIAKAQKTLESSSTSSASSSSAPNVQSRTPKL